MANSSALEDELEKVNRAFHEHASEVENALDSSTMSPLDGPTYEAPPPASEGGRPPPGETAAQREAKKGGAAAGAGLLRGVPHARPPADLRLDQREGLPEDYEKVR